MVSCQFGRFGKEQPNDRLLTIQYDQNYRKLIIIIRMDLAPDLAIYI